jgi:hypothetical protein
MVSSFWAALQLIDKMVYGVSVLRTVVIMRVNPERRCQGGKRGKSLSACSNHRSLHGSRAPCTGDYMIRRLMPNEVSSRRKNIKDIGEVPTPPRKYYLAKR